MKVFVNLIPFLVQSSGLVSQTDLEPVIVHRKQGRHDKNCEKLGREMLSCPL